MNLIIGTRIKLKGKGDTIYTIVGKSPIHEGLRWRKGDWYYHLDKKSGYFHPDQFIFVKEE